MPGIANGRIRTLLLVAVLALTALWGAARAGEAEIEPELVLPPQGMEPAPSATELKQQHADANAVIRRKLLQAELMLRLQRLQQCIELCDEVLALSPGNREAQELKRKASTQRLQERTASLDSERLVRDNALLESATREGLPEPFGPELPRPEIRDEDMPFAESYPHKQSQERLLTQVIPEINLIDADLNYVLQLLFKTTGVNIVYKPEDVAGKTVTIHARDLTLEDILKYLSRTLDIGYTVDKGTVWVYGANNQQAAKALMKPVVIPINVGMTEAGSGRRGPATTPGGGGAPAAPGGDDDDDGAGETHIEEVLTWMESNWPGWPAETKWMVDRKLSRLIISSTPDIIRDVREMITMLDVPCPQVLIVARFVKVGEDDLDQLGLNWNLTPAPQRMPEKEANGNLTPDTVQDNKVRISPTQVNVGVAADALTTGMTSILNDHQLTIALQALQQKTGSKVLIAPRVIAQNDRWATIDLSDKYIWYQNVEAVSNDVVLDDNAQTSTTIIPTDPKEEDLGYRLDVRPRIGTDMKSITLKVIPRITTRVRDENKPVIVSTVDGQQVTNIKIPIINTQTITVDASVEDHHTLVVGGLFLDTDTDVRKNVPVLDKIPLLGSLFKSKDKQRERSCLLIFVTARILTPRNATYTDRVAEAERRLGEQEAAAGTRVTVNDLNRWLGDPPGR